MLQISEYQLNIGVADEHDLFAQLNNTSLLLRISGRYSECETLLKRAMGVMKLPPALSRLLGLCQLALGRKTEALQTLAMAPDDLESQVVRIEEIGRASCRERVCQYVSISVVAVSLKKKNITTIQLNKTNEHKKP